MADDIVQLLVANTGPIRARAHVSAIPQLSTAEWPKSGLEPFLRTHIKARTPIVALPAETLVGIGLVVTRWAYAEWILTDVWNKLMGMARLEGRELEKYPPIAELKKRVSTRLKYLSKQFDPSKLARLFSLITSCDKARNLLAHGVWFREDDGTLAIQDISGDWRIIGTEEVIGKKILPGSVYPTADWFRDKLKEVHDAIDLIEELHHFVGTP